MINQLNALNPFIINLKLDNGSLTERFTLERGFRPIAQMIRQSNQISRIEVNQLMHIISQFTDDKIIYLSNTVKSLKELKKIFDRFGLCSGN